MAQAKHHLAKVFVSRQQQSPFAVCQIQNNVVRDSPLHLRYVQHNMAVLAQAVHNLTIHALIGQKVHAGTPATG